MFWFPILYIYIQKNDCFYCKYKENGNFLIVVTLLVVSPVTGFFQGFCT